jgi:acetolactate synthase-1/2/3 large subunit
MSGEKNGADLLVECLEAAGIEVIYGIPGEENTDLMMALEASSIRFVLTRHEQGAAFMASVYGRLTGRPAGCLATLGPGATNLVTGLADATLDHVPLIAITGQASRDRLALTESHQVVDLDALMAPVTLFTRTVMAGSDIAQTVADALQTARYPKPGAVHISLPEDVAAQPADGSPIEPEAVQVDQASEKEIQDLARTLRAAEIPLVVAGAGVIRAGAARDVAAFCKAHHLPLATSFMGKGLLEPRDELMLFSMGQPFEDHVDQALEASDCVLALGLDPVEIGPKTLSDGNERTVLAIAEQTPDPDAGWPKQGMVQGRLGETLEALSEALDGKRWALAKPMVRAREAMRDDRGSTIQGGETAPLLPAHVLRAIEDDLKPDDVVLSGVGTHKMFIARLLAAKSPGQVIIPNGLAGMGLALPGAIAAAELRRGGRTLAICGDGDFLMNVQEMETAARLGVAMTVLVWVDGGYGLIEKKQDADRGEHTDLSFGSPDWPSLAKAFGWGHRGVETLADLQAALARTRREITPQLVTLPIDYSASVSPNS